MRTVDTLMIEELRELVAAIQRLLWADILPVTAEGSTELAVETDGAFDWSSGYEADAWNPDVALDWGTLDEIGYQLGRFGLRPEKPHVR